MFAFLVFIKLVNHFSKSLTLGVRLAANLIIAYILLPILSDFSYQLILNSWGVFNLFSILLIVAILVLELGVLFIQAYVFCLLAVVYLKETASMH